MRIDRVEYDEDYLLPLLHDGSAVPPDRDPLAALLDTPTDTHAQRVTTYTTGTTNDTYTAHLPHVAAEVGVVHSGASFSDGPMTRSSPTRVPAGIPAPPPIDHGCRDPHHPTTDADELVHHRPGKAIVQAYPRQEA